MNVIFWLLILFLGYTWVGYMLLLAVMAKLTPHPFRRQEIYPKVSVIVTVYNEEQVIQRRIQNLLSLKYPSQLLELIVASDGSDDGTESLVATSAFQGIRLLADGVRRGKSLTQNLAVKAAMGEIIVFTDADTQLEPDFIQQTVKYFADPRVGCVTGEICYREDDANVTTGNLRGFWSYELMLRRYESRAGMLITATGACMALRKALFRDMKGEYGEDCIVPLDVIQQGAYVVVDPEARASTRNVTSPGAEFRARVRMTLRNLTGTLSRRALFNPLKYPQETLALVSHKILRWLTPFFLVGLLAANFGLRHGTGYLLFLLMQAMFYGLALAGFIMEKRRRPIRCRLISAPYSFCLANAGIMVGVIKALIGRKVVTYKN